MLLPLADDAIRLTPPVWDRLVIPLLTVLIYGVLGPLVYLVILVIGVDLSWPGGTGLRRLAQQRDHSRADLAASPDPSGDPPACEDPTDPTGSALADDGTVLDQGLSADPANGTLRAVAGLIAVATLSTVTTIWLAAYPSQLRAPLLNTAFTTLHRTLFFLLVLLLGFIGGFLWTAGMRTARTARASLTVLAFSMSFTSTLLFLYLVEPGLRDTLLVLALGVFAGGLYGAAHHPTLMHEGLFAELLRPPVAEVALPPGDVALSGAETQADAEAWRAQTPTRSFFTAASPPTNDEGEASTPPPPTAPAGPASETTNG